MGSDHVRGYDELQYGPFPQRLRWLADLGRLTCIHRPAWCYARSADEGCNVPVHHRAAQAELHLGEGWPYPRLPARNGERAIQGAQAAVQLRVGRGRGCARSRRLVQWSRFPVRDCRAELLRGSAHGTDVSIPVLAALSLLSSAPDRSTRAVTTISEWLAPGQD